MTIIIILFGISILTLSGYFFGHVIAVDPRLRELEDKEQMNWIRKYQETK